MEDEHHGKLRTYRRAGPKLYDKKVRDLMGSPPITIRATAHCEGELLMILRRIKQLPVADNGRLTGIVTLTDIINFITKAMK
jgi:signal-transduction protein with cAMP-binding, CBS, and nucleotidyltransferase domain